MSEAIFIGFVIILSAFSGDLGMAEVDNELVLEICKLRAEEFDKFSVSEQASRYRNATNRGRIEAEIDPIDHYEWRAKLQKVIRVIEGKLRGSTNN